MIKSKSREAVSVYFRGVSIAQIYYKGLMVWPNDSGDISCFNSGGAWNDELPWNDDANWID